MRRAIFLNNKPTSFQDMVLILALGFFVMFVITFLYFNPIAKLGNVENKAEYIITVLWPDGLPDDIDTWVSDPNGTVTWFNDKDPVNSIVHLDRDDRGNYGDTVVINGKEIKNPTNQEIVALRGIVPGEYIVNLHFYSRGSPGTTPIPVTVKLEKINPEVVMIFFTVDPIELVRRGQEITVVRFEVQEDGTILNVKTYPQQMLAGPTRRNQRQGNQMGRGHPPVNPFNNER